MVKKRDMNNKASFSKRISFLNARMTSTLSVSLVLFILGIMVLMGFLATNLSRHVKEDALKEVMIELGENPEDVLGVNPLQSSIEVKLKADYANTDSLAVIEKNLRGQVIVSDILYQKDLIQSVNDNMSRIGLVLLALAIVLMLISFALISNTIRLGAYSKRFLIHTMKLVGATPAFIRRPFIVSNVINGIVASVIAMLLLSGCIYYLMSEMENFTTLLSVPMMVLVFLSVLILGIILTAVSAYWAVNRYIRMDRDDLYYI